MSSVYVVPGAMQRATLLRRTGTVTGITASCAGLTRVSINLHENDFSKKMDCRVVGERSDAVLRTAMPGNDEASDCGSGPKKERKKSSTLFSYNVSRDSRSG
jgi:hypothetical protein